MDIQETTTKVRAAKTSGICRKAIADAANSLNIAQTVRENYAIAESTLKGSLEDSVVADLLGNISARIREQETEANRATTSVLNAIAKAIDNVKDIPDARKRLEVTREMFDAVEAFIPQVETK